MRYETSCGEVFEWKPVPLPCKCKHCKNNQALVRLEAQRLALCKECFLKFFENRVKKCIETYKMFFNVKKIGIFLSGGKDSSSLLVALKHCFPELSLIGIHINLGIKYHSEEVETLVREVCQKWEVPLYVYDLVKEEGFSIDDFVFTHFKNKICSVCGVIKRGLFSQIARKLELDVVCTGHHLDDMLSTMLNLFFQGSFESLIRLTPTLPPLTKGQVKKVKPFFTTPEKEIFYYAVLREIPIKPLECPHTEGENIPGKKYREFLNYWEKKNPQFKYQALSVFTKKLIPLLKKSFKTEEEISSCKICGEPTSSKDGICTRCKRKELLSQVEKTPLELSWEEAQKEKVRIFPLEELPEGVLEKRKNAILKFFKPYKKEKIGIKGENLKLVYSLVLKLKKLGFEAYLIKT